MACGYTADPSATLPSVANATSSDVEAENSWRRSAGRTTGGEGYQVFDLSRTVFRMLQPLPASEDQLRSANVTRLGRVISGDVERSPESESASGSEPLRPRIDSSPSPASGNESSVELPDYGGDFPWIDCKYIIKVKGGRTSCGPVSWETKGFYRNFDYMLRGAITFHQSGCLHDDKKVLTHSGSVRKNSSPMTVGGWSPRWHWDETQSRLKIDFLSNGKPDPRRWDELKPVGGTDGITEKKVEQNGTYMKRPRIKEWEGSAHTAFLTYSYTLSLEEPGDQNATDSCHAARISDLVRTFSFFATSDSFVCEVRDIVSKYEKRLEDQACVEELSESIDRMFVHETAMMSHAELIDIIMKSADEVEAGADTTEVVARTTESIFWVLHEIALPSFNGRCQNRADSDDLETLRQSLVDKFLEMGEETKPLIQQLADPENACAVKRQAKEILANTTQELGDVSDIKSPMTELAQDLNFKVCQDEQQKQCDFAFALAVLQTARASELGDEDIDKYIDFVYSNAAEHVSNGSLQEACRRTLNHLETIAPIAVDKIRARDCLQNHVPGICRAMSRARGCLQKTS